MANIINGTDTGSGGLITTGDSSDELQLQTAETTAVTIDSSQNVGVGTTTPGARIEATASGAAVQILNRTTSDGTVLQIEKDGTTVGSIGAINGDVGIGTGVCGVKFLDSQPALTPADASNTFANADNSINLGWSSVRWKDLYLSGGVYLGGTGAANYLDDYEEGSFTPNLRGSGTAGTVTYSERFARYTKIGRLVTVQIWVAWTDWTGSPTGGPIISNLPFTVNQSYSPATIYMDNAYTLAANGVIQGYCNLNSTNLGILQYTTGGSNSSSPAFDVASALMISASYVTDS